MNIVQIKHLLIDRNLTISEIARNAGVSRTLVSLILKGERKGYRHRAKIARALGLTVNELFNGNARTKGKKAA